MADTETVAVPETPESVAPTWLESLPEPLRAEKSLATFKDVGALAQSYVETKKLVGSKTEGLVRVPGADSKPEDVAAFRKAMGVPDTPDGYQINRPELALNGNWNPELEKQFLALAHQQHLPPATVQSLLTFYGQMEARKVAEGQRQAQEVMTTLRREMGPNYEANLGRANRAVSQFGGEELVTYLAETGLGRHPAMIKTFVNIANAMVESGAMESAGDPGTSAEEAKAELEAIYADKSHAYNNPGASGWQDASDRVLALRRIVLGSDNRKLVEYR